MSELDALTVYVFVRQDIPLALQLVQSNHATFLMAAQMKKPAAGTPNMIVIGMPHLEALKRVVRKLEANAVPSEIFEDPDFNFGATAVVTYPIDAEASAPLKNYRLWRHVPAASKNVADLSVDAGANADVAQLRERPVSNGEVTGVNPVVGSISRCCP